MRKISINSSYSGYGNSVITDVGLLSKEELTPPKFVRCNNCKFWEKSKQKFERNGYCRQGKLSWWGSGNEYGFSCPPNFYCKFWKQKESK